MTTRHRLLIAALVAASVAVSTAAPVADARSLAATHRCGSFLAEDSTFEGQTSYNRITVFNSQGLSCKTATAVIEGFWGPEGNITQHGGPSDAQSYYTITGFPGWRCTQGAGGGGCRRRHKLAAYSAVNA